MRADEWREWILSELPELPVVELPPAAAHGLFVAEEARAEHQLPLWANSAMDGFAVRAADCAQAAESSPVELRVIGEVAAGSDWDPLIGQGEAVRIMTGAPVPTSADAVVPVEWTADGWDGDLARVLRAPALGANIRRAGEDIGAGDVLAAPGERLTAARSAALAAAGVQMVRVRREPKIAVLVTGSELAKPGKPLPRGRIPESNSVLIAGLLRETGLRAAPTIEWLPDEVEPLRERIAELSASHDAIITTGGVGPGLHDIVRLALAGAEETGNTGEDGPLTGGSPSRVRAVHVDIRPGRPQAAGLLPGGAFLFGLPGNPVSAAVAYELFVRPALLAMQGSVNLHRLRVPAVVDTGWRGAVGRLQVLPVLVRQTADGLRCEPAVDARAVSHAVGRHGAADGYAIVPEDRGDVIAGETVEVLLGVS